MANSEKWILVMRERGHTPVVDDDGSLNIWVEEYDTHNGPGCSVCGWKTCWHCTPNPEDAVPLTCTPDKED